MCTYMPPPKDWHLSHSRLYYLPSFSFICRSSIRSPYHQCSPASSQHRNMFSAECIPRLRTTRGTLCRIIHAKWLTYNARRRCCWLIHGLSPLPIRSRRGRRSEHHHLRKDRPYWWPFSHRRRLWKRLRADGAGRLHIRRGQSHPLERHPALRSGPARSLHRRRPPHRHLGWRPFRL